MTHTYALLEVSPAAFVEIEKKLREAGYSHAINSEGEIDMHGIALVSQEKKKGLNRSLSDFLKDPFED